MVTKIKSFDYDSFSDVQTDLVIKLKEVAKEHGISLKILKSRYKTLEGSFLIKASIVGKDGQVKSQEEEDFRKYAESYGLSPDDLGKSFTIMGKRYTIIGCLPRRHKYPILTHTDRGRRIIHPAQSVAQALKNGTPDDIHSQEEVENE